MQKHQEWLDNRTYEQHIMCLTKIKQNSRKNQIRSAVHGRRRKVSNKQVSQEQLNHTRCQNKQNVHGNTPRVQKSLQITFRQKELLWNNFLLGKRIMETNPVINVRKQQDQYKKHKKLIQWRIQRTKKLTIKTDFRQTKLKEFTENNNRLSAGFRLATSLRSRYILTLKIVNLIFFRPYPHLNDIVVKMRMQGKKTVQTSEIVNIQNLPYYEFYFKYFVNKDKNIQSKLIFIQLYESKGLDEHLIGAISVQRQKIQKQKILIIRNIQRTNKRIGDAQLQISIDRRINIKQTL